MEIIPSFLRLHPSTAFQTLVDYEGYSISSKGFLPTLFWPLHIILSGDISSCPCSSPVAYWTPFDLGVYHLFGFLYSSWSFHGKYTGAVCHSLLLWITFVRTLHYDPSILRGHVQHGSELHSVMQSRFITTRQ